jgi:plasmid stability protein
MNITLSAEEKIVEEARSWAAAHGTSVNALVRDFLAGLVAGNDAAKAAELFARNARDCAGRSEPGERFDRDDTYRGKRFGSPA